MNEKPHPYMEEHASFSSLAEKVKKKSFWKRYFWQIFAISTTLLMVIFGSTTVLLLIKNTVGPGGSRDRSSTPITTMPSTPGSAVTPVPTLTPTLPLPGPQPGVLCETGSSDNWKEWPVQGPWQLLPTNHQILLHDGSGEATLMAPAFCQPKTLNYAVEARINLLDSGVNSDEFGLIVRGGYKARISDDIVNINADSKSICYKWLSIDSGYHTYRVEVSGNEIDILIDGSKVCSAADNRYLSPGQVGLFSDTQIEVTDFKVILL